MPNFLKEVRVLRKEGKLHKKLLSRVRILFIVSGIMLAIVVFDIFFHGLNALIALALAIMGFVLGRFVFSRMNVVNWNEQDEILQTGKMDVVGYASIGLYILVEILFRTFLHDYFPSSATALLLAGIFGTIFGRAVGTVYTIHSVYKRNHLA